MMTWLKEALVHQTKIYVHEQQYSPLFSPFHTCLRPSKVINEGAEALGSANAVLEPEAKSLDSSAVGHPLAKGSGVGAGSLEDRSVVVGKLDVAADRPSTAGLLELGAEHVIVQELGSLRVRSILENTAGLGPRDEATLDGVAGVDGSGRVQAAGGGEGGGPGGVVLAEDGAGSLGAADPAGVLGDELVEPLGAVLLDTV